MVAQKPVEPVRGMQIVADGLVRHLRDAAYERLLTGIETGRLTGGSLYLPHPAYPDHPGDEEKVYGRASLLGWLLPPGERVRFGLVPWTPVETFTNLRLFHELVPMDSRTYAYIATWWEEQTGRFGHAPRALATQLSTMLRKRRRTDHLALRQKAHTWGVYPCTRPDGCDVCGTGPWGEGAVP